jgi:hypothetical protein
MFESQTMYESRSIYPPDPPDSDLEGIWEIERFWQFPDWEDWYPQAQHEGQRYWDVAILSHQQYATNESEQYLVDLREDLLSHGWVLRRYPRRPDPSKCAWNRCEIVAEVTRAAPMVVLEPDAAAPRLVPAQPLRRGRPADTPTIPWPDFLQLCDQYIAQYKSRPTLTKMREYIAQNYLISGIGVDVSENTLSNWTKSHGGWAAFWSTRYPQ